MGSNTALISFCMHTFILILKGGAESMDYLSCYELWLTSEKHASANTLSSYLRDVRQFASWLESEGIALPQATQNDIKQYAKFLNKKGKSDATIVRSVASLKSFYSYMLATHNIPSNPAKGFTPQKLERKLPEILTGKEVDLFLDQPDVSDEKGCRDKAMLELLYATGIRVTELISLDIHDINLSLGFIRCTGKGKERIVPLYKAAIRALSSYINDVRPQLLDEPLQTALFVNKMC